MDIIIIEKIVVTVNNCQILANLEEIDSYVFTRLNQDIKILNN